jgi:hypothetical protein
VKETHNVIQFHRGKNDAGDWRIARSSSRMQFWSSLNLLT